MEDAVTSREIQAIEANMEYFGVSRLQMMETAGRQVADIVDAQVQTPSQIVIFTGPGGNGGDGMVAARYLATYGHHVTVLLIARPAQIHRAEVMANWQAVCEMPDSIQQRIITDSSQLSPIPADVVIDALLGVGIRGSPRPPILQAIQTMNTMKGFKVAIDVPSGINADTGEMVSTAVNADLTITFHKPKIGLVKAPEMVGDLVIAQMGFSREAERFIGPGDVLLTQTPRVASVHKGDFGRLLIIGGSATFSGAPALAGLAALRVGVDLAYIAAPWRTAHDIAAMSSSLITIKLPGTHLTTKGISALMPFINRATAVVMGPGLGLHTETIIAVEKLMKVLDDASLPLLLDADGLKAFARFKYKRAAPFVLTPHAGEYAILTGSPVSTRIAENIDAVKTTAQVLGATLLLKGPTDIVTDGIRLKLNPDIHNPGMTVGGTGDVLSGIVGALLAQGISPFHAAAAGTFINGAAGDFAVDERGYHILPSDLIEYIPLVMDDPASHREVRRRR
ncbi:MAG: NAD(P)H-hydrate dehydratase [Candidatus Bathyarchaeota archaeon]|nr:NAD(P)H-hydrate dehydratase [Candidatus Bathyarchaeota archaeon]